MASPDLVVSNINSSIQNSNSVSVTVEHDGAPGFRHPPAFAARQAFATGGAPGSVGVGDLNGDGKVRLGCRRPPEVVAVLLNTDGARRGLSLASPPSRTLRHIA